MGITNTPPDIRNRIESKPDWVKELQIIKASLRTLALNIRDLTTTGADPTLVQIQWKKIAEKVQLNREIINKIEALVEASDSSAEEIDSYLKTIVRNDFLISLRLKNLRKLGSTVPPEMKQQWKETLLVAFHDLRFAKGFLKA